MKNWVTGIMAAMLTVLMSYTCEAKIFPKGQKVECEVQVLPAISATAVLTNVETRQGKTIALFTRKAEEGSSESESSWEAEVPPDLFSENDSVQNIAAYRGKTVHVEFERYQQPDPKTRQCVETWVVSYIEAGEKLE